MASPSDPFIIDSVHGDIHLTRQEIEVVDTPTFQRLRNIKQLQMNHLTYPNATHNRFVHSLGTLQNMKQILYRINEKSPNTIKQEDQDNLKIAALLHDIGHYPYSHLMEKIEKVQLMEEFVSKEKNYFSTPYPKHEHLGELILTQQPDIVQVVGDRSKKIAALVSGNELDSRLSNLITSSLDLDRIDYLIRDSYATGLPYGLVDRNYLLNSLQINSEGVLGVDKNAIPAVEQFLLSRYFMYRVVYYHRTTVAFEEACRQLLRRMRDTGRYAVPKDGNAIKAIVTSSDLFSFTDSQVDSWIREASTDQDSVIAALAKTIQSRKAPKLLREVSFFEEKGKKDALGSTFKTCCQYEISSFAEKQGIELGRFLWCELPISFEKELSRFTVSQHKRLVDTESDQYEKEAMNEKEIIQIFDKDLENPTPLTEINYSIISILSKKIFHMYRLYVVAADLSKSKIDEMKAEIDKWGAS